ncbi:ion transporter [Romeria aff. gracilis LEGE 07310]|uniref:Ion transporter n=1 Tax=Vasconcelosia minhoensis LEGE 07310 TaxID=915328 RepID=A0A8J7AJ91_9CYAN|nr:ion transporter [Romeria gracilis]MBE9078613.1 ion transporter [Romeria aff. gracilis LEGE 07310]
MISREQVRRYLNEGHSRVGLGVNIAIAVLILLSAVFFVAETYPIPSNLRLGLELADWAILTLFTVEYFIRLWAAKNRLRYFFSLYALIDFCAILPFFLGFLDVRYLRLLRWLRILRLARFLEDKTWFSRISGYDGLIFARILFTLFSIIFIYSGAIYQAEHTDNAENFATFLDAVYFAVVTMTTVGFGDITPISETGRWLTIMMILTGIALIPTQIGNFIKHWTKVQSSRTQCESCGLVGHEMDARYCRRCGVELPVEVEDLEGERDRNGGGSISPAVAESAAIDNRP